LQVEADAADRAALEKAGAEQLDRAPLDEMLRACAPIGVVNVIWMGSLLDYGNSPPLTDAGPPWSGSMPVFRLSQFG
jgi:hypothetical protein